MTYNIALAREQAGISLANYHLFILGTSHLYNALLKKSLIKGHWQTLEKVMEMHKSAMFFGTLPETLTKIYNSFIMRLGGNPAKQKKQAEINIIGKGGDRTGKLPLAKADASCLSISDTAHLSCNGSREISTSSVCCIRFRSRLLSKSSH